MASPALQLATSTPTAASRGLNGECNLSRSVNGTAFRRARPLTLGCESRTEDLGLQQRRLSAAAPVRHRSARKGLSVAVHASIAETQCWRDQPDGAEESGAPTSSSAAELADNLRVPAAQSASSLSQPYGVPQKGNDPEQWDVVGLGQAMVSPSLTAGPVLHRLPVDRRK